MSRSKYLLPMLCGILLAVGATGCGHAKLPSPASPQAQSAQQQFLQMFLAAHERKDVEAQKALVDWENVTDESSSHFLREYIESMAPVDIKSATIEEIPGLSPRFAARYNIPPEKFLNVVYADPRGDIQVKFPIGRKDDGRYYFALDGLTPQAFKQNAERLNKTSR